MRGQGKPKVRKQECWGVETTRPRRDVESRSK